MAVVITRTPWIDDDGTGTTGTVLNNAMKTGLYNEIDAALAKVPQLAGGNTFTGGNQTVNGIFIVTNGAVERFRVLATGEVGIGYATSVAGAMISIAGDAAAGHYGISIVNASATPTMTYMTFYNSGFGAAGSILQNGAAAVVYNTTSDRRLKTDQGRASDLSSLRAVVVHDFAWIADGVCDRGVFAQDAHALYPRAVTVGTDETTEGGDLARPWMTDYSKFVPDLIVGWQQHDAELAELRARLAAVTGEAV